MSKYGQLGEDNAPSPVLPYPGGGDAGSQQDVPPPQYQANAPFALDDSSDRLAFQSFTGSSSAPGGGGGSGGPGAAAAVAQPLPPPPPPPAVSGRMGDAGPVPGGGGGGGGRPASGGFAPQSAPSNLHDAERGQNARIWHVEYYAKYFDVDTSDITARIRLALYPNGNFLPILTSKADLYGPFWVPTTVIFALFATSSLAHSIAAFMAGQSYAYDFTRLSTALSVVYTYAFGIPLLLWGVARYYARHVNVIELWSVYGYGMAIWIPVTLLCTIPIEIVRWSLVGVTAALSGMFVVRNVHSLLSAITTNAPTPVPGPALKVVMLVVMALHATFALLLKLFFYQWTFTASATTP